MLGIPPPARALPEPSADRGVERIGTALSSDSRKWPRPQESLSTVSSSMGVRTSPGSQLRSRLARDAWQSPRRRCRLESLLDCPCLRTLGPGAVQLHLHE